MVTRPAVEDFMRLCSPDNPFWGMADSDVLDLCNYILVLEAALKTCAADYISPECTMSDAYPLVAAEFRHRMRTAAEALMGIAPNV